MAPAARPSTPTRVGAAASSWSQGITQVRMNVIRLSGVPNGTTSSASGAGNGTKPSCHPAQTTEAVVLFTLAGLGMAANIFLMMLIILRRPLRRWSQGLLFHQGLVDCARASLLVPLGLSVALCQRFPKCSALETFFLLLVTVSTVNMLTSVINDAPLLPDQQDNYGTAGVGEGGSMSGSDTTTTERGSGAGGSLLDSPQCIVFGLFIIWFASVTINLGPTFLSGALASGQSPYSHLDVCPMVVGPVRHYVLNALWVAVNLLCVTLTGVHLRKLYRDLSRSNLEAVRIAGMVTTMISVRTAPCSDHIHNYIHRLEREGIRRVKMFVVVLVAYVLFWGPLYALTLAQPVVTAALQAGPVSAALTYEVTLHVAFVHAFVNPTLLLVLHRDLREAALHIARCSGPAAGHHLMLRHHHHHHHHQHHHQHPLADGPLYDVPPPPLHQRGYMETTL